ncbi:PilW family protein [Acidovorax carolinensis]|uniref:PilW family protein n=1 Tax=Acidovorax carolinensis TaxID=553814 RepID=UPI000B342F07|nr:PilW family protein [Acidovorax carolinensis]ART49006.1 prepilin-type cleavage/methylation domain-containing protein [Acidovorax carolinensis]
MKTIQKPLRQRGVTLIELMVGLSIGLLVVAVALGALMVSRGISGTVSDASGIQQQGAYILRVIGQQLRQTGSLYLNPDPAGGGTSTDVLSPVAFEIKADPVSGGNSFDQLSTLAGASDTVTTGFRRYADNVFMVAGTEAAASTPATFGTDYLARNCVGAPGNSSADQRVESNFAFDSTKNELRCGGNGATAQAIAQNVAQFLVTYLVQTVDVGTGTTVKYVKGSDIATVIDDPTKWRLVQGVQVCLVLYGSEPIDMPAGSSYTDCDGNSVNMTTLSGGRKNRMHLLLRNTFQLRSQGLI